jgi:hypothetical protein
MNCRVDLGQTIIRVRGLFSMKVNIGIHNRAHIARAFHDTVEGLEGNAGWMKSKIWMVSDLEILP